jgi:hypothetical protein
MIVEIGPTLEIIDVSVAPRCLIPADIKNEGITVEKIPIKIP